VDVAVTAIVETAVTVGDKAAEVAELETVIGSAIDVVEDAGSEVMVTVVTP
jgi:hypothetical protein